MRGKTKLVSLVAALAVLLISSMVFASGLVNVSRMSLFSGPIVEPDSPGTKILFDPATISGDYVNDPGFQIDDTFTVNVDVSAVTDLFTWHINMSWDHSILNVTKFTYGTFLRATTSPNGTSSWINRTTASVPITGGSNASGFAWAAETILDSRVGATGVSGSGRLVSIKFEIVDYGWTTLSFNTVGTFKTELLDSNGNEIAFDPPADGWFDNRIRGDSDGSGIVTIADMGEVSDRWTAPPGVKLYARFVDWDDNGVISIGDMGTVSDNWGRFVP
jgi:hypothetical protein